MRGGFDSLRPHQPSLKLRLGEPVRINPKNPMKLSKFIPILALGLVLGSTVSFAAEAAPSPAAPAGTKAKCCVKAEKAGEACKHECCEAAAKEHKNCEKCGGTNEVKK